MKDKIAIFSIHIYICIYIEADLHLSYLIIIRMMERHSLCSESEHLEWWKKETQIKKKKKQAREVDKIKWKIVLSVFVLLQINLHTKTSLGMTSKWCRSSA